jgi:hypothetical protein
MGIFEIFFPRRNNREKPPRLTNEWFLEFYKECGREITLAYTTLNQMQNWAIVILGISISAVVALCPPSTSVSNNIPFSITMPIFIVATITFAFILRFFIRAILCYINLTRWNTLQSDLLKLNMLSPTPRPEELPLNQDQLKTTLLSDIDVYYYFWKSPIDRKTQILSNLQLGFALIIFLPLLFVILGAINLWGSSFARGLTIFTIGNVLVEGYDFVNSPFFDNPSRFSKRKSTKKGQVFPIPNSKGIYLILWIVNIAISTIVVFWSNIQPVFLCVQNLFRK